MHESGIGGVGDDAGALDEIVLGRIRAICERFDDVEEVALQDRPLFGVGRHRFAIFNGETSPGRPRWNCSGRSLHFLADADELEALRDDVRFAVSPHHGSRGWFALGIGDPDAADGTEIAELLESAHRMVAPRIA